MNQLKFNLKGDENMAKSTRLAVINKVSKYNEELLVPSLFDETYTRPKVKKIDIAVDKDCTLIINGKDRLFIKSQFGLSLDYDDVDLESLVCYTTGVSIYAILSY